MDIPDYTGGHYAYCESDCASVVTVCPDYQLHYKLYLSVVHTFGRDNVYNNFPDIDTDDDMINKQYNITKLKQNSDYETNLTRAKRDRVKTLIESGCSCTIFTAR